MLSYATRIPVLFSAGFFYFAFRIYWHDWSMDTDAWTIVHSGRILLNEGVFKGDTNFLLVNLVGLLPAGLDSPFLFPLITAILGSAICLAVHEIILGLTYHRGYALAGWGIILLSPMLIWLVMACNSVVYATCFVMGSLYFFMRNDTQKGSAFLVLAALSRPEPFLLIAFVAAYLYRQWKNKGLTTARFLGNLTILVLPPVLWMVANLYKMGDAFYAFERAQTYTLNTGQNYTGLDFPRRFYNLISYYYFSFLALALSISGSLYFFKKIRSLGFLYGYLILSILFYWMLAPFNMPLFQRYLLPVSIYLMILGIMLFKELADKWVLPSPPQKKKISIANLLPVACLLFFIHLPAQSAIEKMILFNKNFDRDIPIVADHLRQKLSNAPFRPITVVASARRISHLEFLLYEYHSRLTFISVRNIYFRKSDLSKEEVNWIVYTPDDFIPKKSALYLSRLMSDGELIKQGLYVAENIPVSEHTQMQHLSR
jgi:hypothetical protein